MRRALLFLLLAVPLAFAGFGDLILTSPQAGGKFHQGDYINLTLVLNNTGTQDGGAVYLTGVTLAPDPCINNGVPITIPGAIACPEASADSGCVQRFRNANMSNTYTFRNVSTVEGCGNGRYRFSLVVAGNNEVGQGGFFGPFLKSKSTDFELDFIGPLYCGDRICTAWKGENCTTCSVDCLRCPECVPGAIACVNDSVGTCDWQGYWETMAFCEAGCHIVNETPRCVAPCVDGTKECIAENILAVCVAKRWENRTCPYGCIFDSCKGNCDEAGCPPRCILGLLYSEGTCDHVRGTCNYAKNETCGLGCNADGSACMGQEAGGGGMDLMLIVVPIIVIIAAIIAYLKFFKKREPPMLDDIMPPDEPHFAPPPPPPR